MPLHAALRRTDAALLNRLLHLAGGAENFGSFFGVWRYPNQLLGWAPVDICKWPSWAMLAMLSFTLVTQLKHVKERIQLAA